MDDIKQLTFTVKGVSKETFVKLGVDHVLALTLHAMNEYVRRTTHRDLSDIWRDYDVLKIAAVLEEHLKAVADRIDNPKLH